MLLVADAGGTAPTLNRTAVVATAPARWLIFTPDSSPKNLVFDALLAESESETCAGRTVRACRSMR